MSNNKFKSYTFVFFQFLCLILIFKSGPLIASGFYLYILEFPGLFLGLWAIWVMKIGNFNISPKINHHGRFVENGPYRIIRHPMYLSVLMVTVSMVLNVISMYRCAVWVVLLVNLLMKLNHEEKLLAQHFKEYPAYRKRSKRLIPFIY